MTIVGVVVGAAVAVVVVGWTPRCVPPVHATASSESVRTWWATRAAALLGRTMRKLSHGP
jgi:hypothetical protein